MYNHKTFLLIEVIERDISTPAFFPDEAAARHEMMDRLKQVIDLTDEDIASAEPCCPVEGLESTLKTCGDDIYFSNTSASCERHGQNYDWQIFEQDMELAVAPGESN